MKASDLSHAICLNDKLKDTERLYHIVARGEGLGITIQSVYQSG